jgi:transketolase
VVEINGHNFGEIIPALQSAKARDRVGQPTIILAHTVKGKGLSFTEGKFEWHAKVAGSHELEIARRELEIEEVVK